MTDEDLKLTLTPTSKYPSWTREGERERKRKYRKKQRKRGSGLGGDPLEIYLYKEWYGEYPPKQYLIWLIRQKTPELVKKWESEYAKAHPEPKMPFGNIPMKCEDWKAHPIKWLETEEQWIARLKAAGYEGKEQYYHLCENLRYDEWQKREEEAVNARINSVIDEFLKKYYPELKGKFD
jgi:hypothetical protein